MLVRAHILPVYGSDNSFCMFQQGVVLAFNLMPFPTAKVVVGTNTEVSVEEVLKASHGAVSVAFLNQKSMLPAPSKHNSKSCLPLSESLNKNGVPVLSVEVVSHQVATTGSAEVAILGAIW